MVSKYDKKFQTLIHFATSREAGEYLQKNLPEKSLILFKAFAKVGHP
jgi:UDP-N-acetylmuramyl pentapeptide synthase